MSDGARLRGPAPAQHGSEKMSKRWRAVGDTVSDLTEPGIKPKTCRSDSDVLITKLFMVQKFAFSTEITQKSTTFI